MRYITVKPLVPGAGNTPIPLGHRLENEATQITFDVAKFIDDFGDGGTFVLLHQRPGDCNPYPVAATLDGTGLTWLVTSADLAKAGRGECELQYLTGDVVVKSCTWPTRIMTAMKDPGEAPPAETGWVKQMLSSIQELIATGLYCGFEIDPETGILTMITAEGYSGLTFEINDNGYLEVVI
ncbi:MAG: hypothetical protein LUG61_11215 [Lachnospiraceae bacterium]|nr:hypothetical protein [Lachnospiraceae bacterium]